MTAGEQVEHFTTAFADLCATVPKLLHAVAVAPDGLVLGRSGGSGRTDADRLAAITSGLASLAGGAARTYRLGVPAKVIIEFAEGHLLVSAIGRGAMLGLIAAPDADVGVVAYEMAMFAGTAGPGLTPEVMARLKIVAD